MLGFWQYRAGYLIISGNISIISHKISVMLDNILVPPYTFFSSTILDFDKNLQDLGNAGKDSQNISRLEKWGTRFCNIYHELVISCKTFIISCKGIDSIRQDFDNLDNSRHDFDVTMLIFLNS